MNGNRAPWWAFPLFMLLGMLFYALIERAAS